MNTQSQTFPLSKLVYSALNVRNGIPTEENVSGLAASIKAHGLIENLVVTPEQKKMGVVAGRRRLAAMQLLLKRKQIKADFPVRCEVIDKARAVEISAAENSNREELSVVEEFLAFRKMSDSGLSLEDIAAHFGVTPLVVQRRLKLASVAPTFIDMLRSGEIDSVDVLMALALTDDHDKQQQVWSQLRPYERSAGRIRALLTPESIDYPRDPVAKFVGLKAYEKAGGAVFRDLFSDDEKEVKLLDVALVHRLAQQKLDAKAEALKADGFAWVEGRISFDYSDRHKYGTTVMRAGEPTTEQQQRIDEISARIGELDKQIEACDQDQDSVDASDDFYDERADLEDELNEIEKSLQIPDPAFTHLVGAVVSLNHGGRVEVTKGLIRPEDKKVVKEAEGKLAQERRGNPEDDADNSTGSVERSEFSERITRALTAHLTVALRVKVAESPKIAMAMYVSHALRSVVGGVAISSPMPLEIQSTSPSMHDHAVDIATCKATQTNAERIDAWRARLPEQDLLAWLLALPGDDLSALFALCVAQTVNAVTYRNEPHEGIKEVMSAVTIDMAEFWRPTGENYLGGISKSQILADVAATSADVAESLKQLKKGELIEKAQAALAQTRWVPTMFRV